MTIYKHETNEEVVIDVLETIEFTPERKMMTVVCRIDNIIYVLSKGADSAIYEICSEKSKSDPCFEQANILAKKGLRTLCFAYKKLTPT